VIVVLLTKTDKLYLCEEHWDLIRKVHDTEEISPGVHKRNYSNDWDGPVGDTI
jgi:hypothetical protein